MGLLDNLVGKNDGDQNAGTPVKKVLIVEDDGYIRDVYAEIVRGEGFEVITAENGQLGLDAVKSQKPNLVLMDLMLPVMDGKQMLHEIREIPEFKDLPVIVLTNAGTTENWRETKMYNKASEFLIKANVTPGDIVAKIKALI